MNWSRAKNILIVLLLVVNIFLLVTYIVRENSARMDEITVREDVCRILAGQGIKVSADSVPLDSIKIRPAILTSDIDIEKAATRLFGEFAKSEDEGGVVCAGENGNIMISKNNISLVYNADKEVRSRADAELLAKSLVKKFSVSTNAKNLVSETADRGYIVKVPQFLSGVHVFDCGIEFKISPAGSVIASGKFIGGNISTVSDEVINTSSLLLSFADGIKAKGISDINVSEVNLGYVSKNLTQESVFLAPTIEFVTDKGTFFVDMQSGEIE